MSKLLFSISIALFFLSCVSNPERHKKMSNQTVDRNLYDLYYLDLMRRNKNFNVLNIDVLKTDSIKKSLLNEFATFLEVDSLSLKRLNNEMELELPLIEINISDSIKKKIKGKERKLKVIDFFSRPLELSDSQKVIFFETRHELGRSDGVIFFSNNYGRLWELDSTIVLNNYRGGGFGEKGRNALLMMERQNQ